MCVVFLVAVFLCGVLLLGCIGLLALCLEKLGLIKETKTE